MAPLSAHASAEAAERSLFARLIDDAAVFPPGNSPLPEAFRTHRHHRQTWYADLIGPLLVPTAAATELVHLVESFPDSQTLGVGLIARPGVAESDIRRSFSVLRAAHGIDVVGVECAWTPSWRSLDTDGVPLSLEIPRGDDFQRALLDLAQDTSESSPVQAKFRTGPTPTWPWPPETELAAFIHACTTNNLAFKLTGGLHHTIRATHEVDTVAEEQHGLLNVLVATASALDGAAESDLTQLLSQHQPDPLVHSIAQLSRSQSARVRAFFTAYGCCGVTDPISELLALNLIEE